MTPDRLEAIVKATERTFITTMTTIVVAALGPVMQIPIVGWILKLLITHIITILAREGRMVAFIINTRGVVDAQASDFVAKALAVDAVDPSNTEEWERREDEANRAFRKLIGFTH